MITRDYGLTHRALLDVGVRYGLSALAVRFLVAVQECAPPMTDVLARQMHTHDSSVRRAMLECRPEFVRGGDRRGERTTLELTAEGKKVVKQFYNERRWLEDLLAAA